MRKNKNILRILSLGIGLTILACNDSEKNGIVEVDGDKEKVTLAPHEEMFLIEVMDMKNVENIKKLYDDHNKRGELIGYDAIKEGITRALQNNNEHFIEFVRYTIFPDVNNILALRTDREWITFKRAMKDFEDAMKNVENTGGAFDVTKALETFESTPKNTLQDVKQAFKYAVKNLEDAKGF